MTINKHPIDLGAPLPDLKNSPIIGEFDDEREMIDPEIPEERVCYFNDQIFMHGSHIKSGTVVLKCDRGVWVETDVPEAF